MAEPLLDRLFPAQPDRLCDIRRTLAEAARPYCTEDDLHDVVLAVDEACQNIIRHAYKGSGGDIRVMVEAREGTLDIRLIDFAPPVDPANICPRALDDVRPGGLGTHFIRSVMDEVAFEPPPSGAGNMLRMMKRIGKP